MEASGLAWPKVWPRPGLRSSLRVEIRPRRSPLYRNFGGAPAEFVDLDVLDETSCLQAIRNAVERFGRLDILVNNTGTTVRKQPEDLTAQE